MEKLKDSKRIEILKNEMLEEPRYASIEQARIITRIYQENENLSVPLKRALALKTCLEGERQTRDRDVHHLILHNHAYKQPLP